MSVRVIIFNDVLALSQEERNLSYMLFNSTEFLIFFPIVIMLYYIIPARFRYIWLLVSSYYFYMCWNAKYAILLLISTVITYLSGILIGRIKSTVQDEKKRIKLMKCCVALSFISNLGILAWFKYFNFAFENIQWLMAKVGVELASPAFDIVLPVGISFYTFQALSYTMDVYRGDIYEEKNFLKYALFVSFFPQLVAGPIERSKNLLKQVAVSKKFNWIKAQEGIILMLWGFFMKLVVSDRAAIVVNTVYNNYQQYPGVYLGIATVLFAFQIYCDFGGYSVIAMGAAKILGFDLMENFDCPYFSSSVAEFWRRWHISLSSWFKDYLYIPLGGNRKGTVRKYVNLMIVFLMSGLWHGAQWTFVVWGALNGAFQVIGGLLKPIRDKIASAIKLGSGAKVRKFIGIVVTFVLINFTWVFFRANTFSDAIGIVKSLFTTFNYNILVDGSIFKIGLDKANAVVMLLSIVTLLVADMFKYKGIKVREWLLRQNVLVKWALCVVTLIVVLVFGIYGLGYEESAFIYFQF